MSSLSSPSRPETEPGVASADAGLVILDGPDGVAVTMTADAAARTGQSLITAAGLARQQMEEGQGAGTDGENDAGDTTPE